MRHLVDSLNLIESTNITTAEQSQLPVTLGEDSGIVRAAAILAIGNVTSRILGLVREIVKSNLFGASPMLAAYSVAALVPLTLFNLISGGEMVSSSLVPVFSDYAAKERRHELWRVASTCLSLATVLLLVILLVVELFAPQVAWLAGARNFQDPALGALTTKLMRLTAPAVLFLSIASILTGVLYSLKRFTLPAFTAAVFNGAIVVVALLNPDEIISLAWGLLLGSFLQIVLQLPGLRDGTFRIRLDWHHPAVRRIALLYAPIAAGLIVNQIAIWISYNLAITTGDVSVTYMTYATTLYQFPLGLVVTAVSIAILPTLSRLATSYHLALEDPADDAELRLSEYKSTLAGGLRLVITLIVPAALGLFVLALPIIKLLLEHGQFLPDDTTITATVLRFYLFGLPFAALDQMLVMASYARKDTWRPAAVGVISIVIYTIVAALLLPSLGLLSLMVADAVKHFVHALIMLWLLHRFAGRFSGYGILPSLGKTLIAALFTALAAYFVADAMNSLVSDDVFIARFAVVASAGLAGLTTYVAAVYILDIRDAKSLWYTFRKKPSDSG